MEAHEQLDQLISLNEEINEVFNQESIELTKAIGLWGVAFGGWIAAQVIEKLTPTTIPGLKEATDGIVQINTMVSHITGEVSHTIAYSLLSARSELPEFFYSPLSNLADFIGSHDTFHEVFLLGNALLGIYFYTQHIITATKLESLYKLHNKITGYNRSFRAHQDIMSKTTTKDISKKFL